MISSKTVHYKRGYKYQLSGNHYFRTDVKPLESISAGFVSLYKSGILYLKSGYAWDGCSGPTWDDRHNMRGGLIHDALYQLIRMGILSADYKDAADRELQKCCIEDGMLPIRAWYYYQAVKLFGGGSCTAGKDTYPVILAP